MEITFNIDPDLFVEADLKFGALTAQDSNDLREISRQLLRAASFMDDLQFGDDQDEVDVSLGLELAIDVEREEKPAPVPKPKPETPPKINGDKVPLAVKPEEIMAVKTRSDVKINAGEKPKASTVKIAKPKKAQTPRAKIVEMAKDKKPRTNVEMPTVDYQHGKVTAHSLKAMSKCGEPCDCVEGIGPVTRKANGHPDWQYAHDQLITMKSDEGYTFTEIAKMLGNSVSPLECRDLNGKPTDRSSPSVRLG